MYLKVYMTDDIYKDCAYGDNDKLHNLKVKIGALDGVDDVLREEEELLLDIGHRLFQLEDDNNFNCPIREMREELEAFLNERLDKVPKGS